MKSDLTFEHYLRRLRHTEQTIRSYTYAYSVFIIDNPHPEDYHYKDIIRYINLISSKDESPSKRIHLLNGIKKYYDYLIDIGRRNDHPCRGFSIKNLRGREVIHQDLFSSKELELLMNREDRYVEMEQRNRVLSSLLIYQGLSSGEIHKLNISHIDLDNGTIFIKASPKISQRHLELSNKQFRLFELYINEGRKLLMREDSEPFLLNKLGRRTTVDDINYYVSTFKGLFPDRNLNAGTIRQSVISNWLNEKKISLEDVQLLSGQRWISTTARYRHNSMEENREIMNKFFPLK
jgi:integrase/recombinase XerD